MARLSLLENAVQDAALAAVERSLDAEPIEEGWLLTVAHRRVVDALRHELRSVPFDEEDGGTAAPPEFDIDDELRLLFTCCHPSLPRAAQAALTLRLVHGLEPAQIARIFLSGEATIAQRILRAKQRLRDERVRFELPEPSEVPARLEGILDVLYHLFTEGHATTTGAPLVDDALCAQSLRIVRTVTDDPRWTTPAAEALRALLCFHTARNAARVASDGSLLLIQEQDRSAWDGALLDEGFARLGRSARGASGSRFHFEAGIAACHAAARSFAETDWQRISYLYDRLREVAPSPVVDVNRALALSMWQGARAGLDELDAIPERALIARYPYALAAYAELTASLGDLDGARDYLDRALAEQSSEAERALLRRKRAALG